MAEAGPPVSSDPSSFPSKIFTVLSLTVVIVALYAAQEVLIPLALAVLVSFLLAPVVRHLERLKLPRGPSVLVVVLLTFAVLGLIGWMMFHQVQSLATDFPKYQVNIRTKFEALSSHMRFLGKIHELEHPSAATQPTTASTAMPVQMIEPPPNSLVLLRNTLGPALSPLGTTGIVIIFVIFMLLEREDVRDRVIRLVGRGQITVTTQAMDDAASRVSRYLLMQSIVNGTFGTCVGLGLWFIGIPQPALWGLLGAILRFVPYIGPWLAASMPFLLSMAVSPPNSWVMPVEVLGLFVALELSISQFLEPVLYGSSTGISPLAILVAAVFWTWLWGPVGLLLSTPLTVCLVVMGKYVPQLQFLDIMLGSEPVLDPPARLYQRLVAGDTEEASDLIDEYLIEKTPVQLYDDVVLPALSMTEEAFKFQRLTQPQRSLIIDNVAELMQDVPERREQIRAKNNKALKKDADEDGKSLETISEQSVGVPLEQHVRVLCLPAHDDADNGASLMLAQVLKLEGYDVAHVDVEALAAEMMDKIAQERPDIVCIVAIPPDAVIYTRYLCKRLVRRFEGVRLIAGLLGAKSQPEQLAARLRCDQVNKVVVTVRDALAEVGQIAHALIVERATAAATTPAVGGAPARLRAVRRSLLQLRTENWSN